jgi:hypothetical protein
LTGYFKGEIKEGQSFDQGRFYQYINQVSN